MLSIPFLFFSTGLPLLMLRGNAHPKTVQKILLWTPVVPLVIVQVALRAIVLTTLISHSADRVWAVCEACEGWSLLLQVRARSALGCGLVEPPIVDVVYIIDAHNSLGALLYYRWSSLFSWMP